MNYFKNYAMIAALALGFSGVALASPAKPGVLTVKQPDGTTLAIRKVGNEFLHFTLTTDNKIVVQDANGQYSYANVDETGALLSTGVLARNLSERPAADELQAVDIKDVNFSKINPSRRRRAVAQSGMGRFTTNFPTTGNIKGLVILVNYADLAFKDDSKYTTTAYNYFYNMLNQTGFSEKNGTGSAKDYFEEMSQGQFILDCDVVGPYTVSKNYAYYGENDRWGNDMHASQMIVEACQLADADVNFSDYDNDNDGYCDFVYVIYAGEGESSGAGDDYIWPYSYNLSYTNDALTLDGVTIDNFACSNEWDSNNPDGIGTFVHEFSHVLGLPDIYYTGYGDWLYCTPGDYDVLDVGCYNNNSHTPAAFSAYERNAMGWIDLTPLPESGEVSLQNLSESNTAYIVPTDKENEFYLFENRQKTGWDKNIPYHGMLIWHIDFDQRVFDRNEVNNTENHQYVDLVEANNTPDNSSKAYTRGWPWPGSKKITEFSPSTTPSFTSWSGESLGLTISDIAETNSVISFKVTKQETGVNDIVADTEPNIEVSGRTLHLSAVSGAVEVYDIVGRCVAKLAGAGNDVSVNLPASGTYVLRVNNKASKVVVR